MLKKRFVLLFVVIMSVVWLVGCSENTNSEIVGEWVPTTANLNGESIKYSDLGLEDGYFYLEFFESGKYKATIAGVDSDGKYTFNDSSVDIDVNGEKQKINYSNNTLTLILNYGETKSSFCFVRKAVE